MNGSVETKLMAGINFKREYQNKRVFGDKFQIEYAFCVSKFLQDKIQSTTQDKYIILKEHLDEDNIDVLF